MRLELNSISKSFTGVSVLKNVNLEIYSQEVHALMGENGAGKSTLMKIISGIYQKDSGDILIDGEQVEIDSIKKAAQFGITLIHQELNLLPEMSILDNMFLGRMCKKNFFQLDIAKMRCLAEEKLSLFGFKLPVFTLVGELSIGQRQLIELARAMLMDSRLVIMDEPTASLSLRESESLFEMIRNLKRLGVSVIYISHRIDEVTKIADRVTVLRDGRSIATKDIHSIPVGDIIRMMVGRDIDDQFPYQFGGQGEILLEVKNISNQYINNISFNVRKGEVLGFSGLIGAGRTEVMKSLCGIYKISGGRIYLNKKRVHINTVIDAKNLGIGFITEDRKNEGIIVGEKIRENLILTMLQKYSKYGFSSETKISTDVSEYQKDFNIKFSDDNANIESLSGGNQQKIVISKWLNTEPELLILDEPTRGIDVGSKNEIYKYINYLKMQKHMGIIVVSSDLSEVMGISDRIAVMSQGRITTLLDREEFDQEIILKKSLGPIKNISTEDLE